MIKSWKGLIWIQALWNDERVGSVGLLENKLLNWEAVRKCATSYEKYNLKILWSKQHNLGLERFENVALIPTIINIYRYRPNIKTMFYRAMSTYNTEIKEEY